MDWVVLVASGAMEAVWAQALDRAEGFTRPLPTVIFFAALAEHLSQNETLGRGYCEHVPSELLFEHLSRPLVRQSVERGFVRGDVPDEELEMLLAFGLGGLFSLYRWWLLSDRAVPLTEVTRRACQLLEGGAAALMH